MSKVGKHSRNYLLTIVAGLIASISIPASVAANSPCEINLGRGQTETNEKLKVENMTSQIRTPDIKMLNTTQIDEVVRLIGTSMNENEGAWAEKTIKFHFFCQANNIDDGRKYFVAMIDGKVVGITGLHNYEWGPRDITWLGWFAVSPEMQGQKIGYVLMNETIKKARELNYRKIFIETYTGPDFERARKFYGRYGFKETGQIKEYIDQKTDMVVFSLDL